MRPSKYDKYVCVACLIIFLYSFFVVGGRPIYESERENMGNLLEKARYLGDDGHDEVVAWEYPTSVFIAPVACLLFFGLWLFEKPLRPIDRRFVKKKIKDEIVRIKKHFSDYN